MFFGSGAKKLEENIQYFLKENDGKIEIISTNQSINNLDALFTIIYKEIKE